MQNNILVFEFLGIIKFHYQAFLGGDSAEKAPEGGFLLRLQHQRFVHVVNLYKKNKTKNTLFKTADRLTLYIIVIGCLCVCLTIL